MNLNSTDFKVMVEVMGWKRIPTYLMPYPSSEQHVFVLNGFTLYYKNYYAVVDGKMPILEARELFNTYNNEQYQIRVGGNSSSSKPDMFKTHIKIEEYYEDKNNIFNGRESKEEVENKVKKFKGFTLELGQEDPDGFYVECYHIDTTEGLKVFTDYIKENNIQSKWWDGISE